MVEVLNLVVVFFMAFLGGIVFCVVALKKFPFIMLILEQMNKKKENKSSVVEAEVVQKNREELR